MVLASLLRKISPSEKSYYSGHSFAMENIKTKVEIKTNNGLRVVGTRTQNNLANPPDENDLFQFRSGTKHGIGSDNYCKFEGKASTMWRLT
jgi:hypothetical protein